MSTKKGNPRTGNYVCSRCKESFSHSEALENHEEKAHTSAGTESKVFAPCNRCGREITEDKDYCTDCALKMKNDDGETVVDHSSVAVPVLECVWCNEEYEIKPRSKGRSRFCSDDCKWRALFAKSRELKPDKVLSAKSSAKRLHIPSPDDPQESLCNSVDSKMYGPKDRSIFPHRTLCQHCIRETIPIAKEVEPTYGMGENHEDTV